MRQFNSEQRQKQVKSVLPKRRIISRKNNVSLDRKDTSVILDESFDLHSFIRDRNLDMPMSDYAIPLVRNKFPSL